ncbi:hypothetical protein CC1G_06671 [Coprinopsis cinerea okayama7|uniref:Uncharacterized protein n=1 Tax=Coprinopsis cinerea (strain Okayama-7 / 130 / ATCC MYA-4618 / FGSC 9003) TaxID=240176 RepID=A8P7Y9_COPC7|nr:hypothetical protein CC1G_06671 [Coprinopsis cinerea okayama7\|eukprot:XP_001839458.2 hypothetical protein CC1G_06671 [Coprinopsis cinerea okayama7\
MDANTNLERRASIHMENHYVNSLNNATRQSTGGSNARSAQHPSNSADQEREQFAEEYKKTVTIIFWYKANTEPLRIQQSVSSFPYFQLSRLGPVVSDLGLDSSSYMDAYNASSSQWEQHTIMTVRMVETQQRLLYRTRKSLLEGLREEDCLGLREEIQLQNHYNQLDNINSQANRASPSHEANTGQKRYATDTLQSSHPSKVHIHNGYYSNQLDTSSSAQNNSQQQQQQQQQQQAPASLPTPPTTGDSITTQTSNETDYTMYRPQQQQQQQQQQYYHAPTPAQTSALPSYLTDPKSATPPIPYHPHPPLKRWPNDYTVYELTVGFNAMDALIAQSPAGANMTQKVAFERVFGSRYVKSTVCRHRAIWKKADVGLKQQFEALGTDDRACWGEFVRRVEGRPSGKAGNHELPPVQTVIDYSQPSASNSGGTTTEELRDDTIHQGTTTFSVFAA